MQETTVNYNNQKFWIKESFLELLSHYICETFEEIGVSTFNPVLWDIYDSCDLNKVGAGIVPCLVLDDVISATDKNTLISVLQQAKSKILSLGTEISVNELNRLENKKELESCKQFWDTPVRTQSLATTIDYIIELLNGTFQYHNRMIHYINFPNPNNAYIMV
jgi:hypothetical protein